MNNTFNVPKSITEAETLYIFHTRLNYDSATNAGQEPRTHILHIKTYPHDAPILDHFSKPARFEFPYNEQNIAYINFRQQGYFKQ